MTASIRGGIFTMAMLLKGAEVAKALTEELHAKTEELKKNGVEPCLAILRVGAREDDLAYERGALKRCEKVGVAVRQVVLPEDVTQEVLMENIHALNADKKVHGVLMFRPLPGHLDDEAARAALDPKKDMDGITDGSMTAVYAGTKGGYPPCTAAACVALLKHYNIPIKGKRVVVIGRSLVIGKPVSLLLLAEHATWLARIVLVTVPTPPGTGVMASTTGSTSAKRVSPQRLPSAPTWMPTSSTT